MAEILHNFGKKFDECRNLSIFVTPIHSTKTFGGYNGKN